MMLLLAKSERAATGLNMIVSGDAPHPLFAKQASTSFSLSVAIVRGGLCDSDVSEKCKVVRWSNGLPSDFL